MDIITGYTGKAHVTAEQDRDINIGIFGKGSCVLRTGQQLNAVVISITSVERRLLPAYRPAAKPAGSRTECSSIRAVLHQSKKIPQTLSRSRTAHKE